MISSRGWRVKSTFLRCVGVRTVSGVRACVFCSAFDITRIKIPVFLGIFFLLRYSTDELKKTKKHLTILCCAFLRDWPTPVYPHTGDAAWITWCQAILKKRFLKLVSYLRATHLCLTVLCCTHNILRRSLPLYVDITSH